MIKLLKLASYLSIALAVSTLVFAGIGITRENDTFSERADFLDEPTVIEQLRELKIPKTDEDKTSPLVIQAKAFALRIDPPVEKKITRKVDPGKGKTGTAKNTQVDTSGYRPVLPATYKLVATCRYEDFPEKSLAMLDVTSKGLVWFRQGDEVGPNILEKIDDGSIVLLQGGKRQTLEVPKQNTVSSLLKGSGGDVTATIAPPASVGSTIQPTRRALPPTSGRKTGYSNLRRTARKRPARPTSEEARKTAEKRTAELKGILDDISSKPKGKDDSKAKDGQNDLMKAVMKMLEASGKKTPPKKDSSK